MSKLVTLIPNTPFNQGPTISSIKEKAAGYFGSNYPVHTVSYVVMSNFAGEIVMQGTIASDPKESDWANIPGTAYNTTQAPSNETVTNTFKGNYVWLRAKVTNFTSGSIGSVSYRYKT